MPPHNCLRRRFYSQRSPFCPVAVLFDFCSRCLYNANLFNFHQNPKHHRFIIFVVFFSLLRPHQTLTTRESRTLTPFVLPHSNLKQLPGKYLTCPALFVPSLLVGTVGSSERKMIAANASNLRKLFLSLTFTNKLQNAMTCVCFSNPMVS
jgi:hypothetical protein